MTQKVREGCITLVLENLKLSHYYCTFPIPKEVAEKLQYIDCQHIKGKWYFVKHNQDLDALWYEINRIQVTVNDWKVSMYEQKKLNALSRCVEYKTKQ